MEDNYRIAIVGMDCRYPGANNIQEYWENILSLRQQFRTMPKKRLNLDYYGSDNRSNSDTTYSKKASVLSNYHFDRIKYRVSKTTFEQTDMAHWLALDVAAGALKDAGFENGIGLNNERVGVIIGNSLTGEFTRANLMRLRWPYVFKVLESTLSNLKYKEKEISKIIKDTEKVYKEPFPIPDADTLAGGLSNTIAGRICNYFDFNGCGYTVDGACSSSLLALTNGCTALMNDELDTALVGGVDLSIDPFEMIGFSRNGALASTEMEVFSDKSQGFWPGEGCGIIVIMKESEAIKRGLDIYAVIHGWGISSDGKGGMTRPKPKTQQLAIQRAYEKASYDISSVAMFEAHGTGTPIGDEIELTALVNEIQKSKRIEPAIVGSVKQLIGHTKAAAGIAGVIKTSLAIKNQIIPCSKIGSGIHPVLDKNGNELKLALKPLKWEKDTPLCASVSSFGFGGINVHITMKEYDGNIAVKNLSTKNKAIINTPRDYEIFPISSLDKKNLVKKIERLKTISKDISRAEFIDLSISLTTSFKNQGKWKASFVAKTPDTLFESCVILLNEIKKEKNKFINFEKGIFFNSSGKKEAIAFLFPGQGSPIYSDLGIFSNLNKELLNGSLILNESIPAFNNNKVIDTSIAQPIIVKNTLQSLDLLKNLGIEADIGIGHSLGEISALSWANVILPQEAIKISQERGNIMSKYGKINGAMLAIRCNENELKKLLQGSGTSITGYNGKNNYVLGGSIEEIKKAESLAFQKEIPCSRLKVSHAFHTSMMSKAARVFKEELIFWDFKSPTKSIISTVTGEVLSKNANIYQHLFEQLEKPVLFTQAINKAKKEASLFIEVGPGNTLSRTLKNDTEIQVVPLNFGSNSIKGLLNVLSAAHIFGKEVHFDEISYNRFHRKIDLDNWKLDVLVNPCEKIEYKESSIKDILNHSNTAPTTVTKAPKSSKQIVENSDIGVLNYLKELISDKTEIPVDIINDEDRIMSQIHLNSLAITEIVSLVTKAFNKSHSVFSEVSILANADGTIKELSNLIYNGESNAIRKNNKENINLEGLINWTHVFKRKNIDKKISRIKIKENIGKITVKNFTTNSLSWEKTLQNRKLPIGNGFIFVYNQEQGVEQLNNFISFLNQPELLQCDFVVLVEIHTNKITGDLKPVFRSFHQESPHIKALAIQLDSALENKIDLIIDELQVISKYKEVIHKVNGIRKESEIELFFPKQENLSKVISKTDVILVTGGGKGITFQSGLQLAKTTKAKLAIIGRSLENKDNTLSANLALLKEKGVEYKYYSSDVCNAKEIKKTVKKIYSDFGNIDIILHGAGVNHPKRISDLTLEDFNKTLQVKVLGLKNIINEIDLKTLKLVVGYGSIIAESGMQGNADYAWANDQLARYIDQLAEKYNCRCITLEWSVWDEIGMGASLNSINTLKQQGVWPIPVANGIKILKTIIADKRCTQGRYIISGRYGKIPTLVYAKKRLPLGRFIEKVKNYVPNVEVISEVTINLKDDVYLKNHVFKGQYVFPTVMILEGMAQCCSILNENNEDWSFENLKINKSIFIPEDGMNTIRFIITRIAEKQFYAIVQSEDSNFEINCFEAKIIHETIALKIEPLNIKDKKELNFNVEERFYDDLLFHHGSFRRISSFLKINAFNSLAKVNESKSDKWFGSYMTENKILGDPGLNDAAIHCHQATRPAQQLLPTSAKKITICNKQVKGQLFIKTSERYEKDNETIIDVYVVNENGEVQQVWEELILTQVSGVHKEIKWTSYFLLPYLEYTLKKLGVKNSSISLNQCNNLIRSLKNNSSSESIVLDDFSISLVNTENIEIDPEAEISIQIELEDSNSPALLQIKPIKKLTPKY